MSKKDIEEISKEQQRADMVIHEIGKKIDKKGIKKMLAVMLDIFVKLSGKT